MMLQFILENLLKPVATRVGAYNAGIFTTIGATQPEAQTLQTALIVVASVVVDLITRKLRSLQ